MYQVRDIVVLVYVFSPCMLVTACKLQVHEKNRSKLKVKLVLTWVPITNLCIVIRHLDSQLSSVLRTTGHHLQHI